MLYVAFGGIGIIAIVGTLLAVSVYRTLDELSGRIGTAKADSCKNLKIFEDEKLTALRKIVEEQDALIAALWHRAFGHAREERFGRADWVEYYGVAPPWYSDAMEYPNVYDTLRRRDPYPWGRRAECLQLPPTPKRNPKCPDTWLGFLVEELSFGRNERYRISIPKMRENGYNQWQWSQEFESVEALLDFCFANGEEWWNDMQRCVPPDSRFFGIYPYATTDKEQLATSR